MATATPTKAKRTRNRKRNPEARTVPVSGKVSIHTKDVLVGLCAAEGKSMSELLSGIIEAHLAQKR